MDRPGKKMGKTTSHSPHNENRVVWATSLHAQFLNFQHPITGEPINLEAALPAG